MKYNAHSQSPEESLAIARIVGASLPSHARVFLDGPMGTGKTLLAKGIYLGCGGKNADQVVSPSYTLVNLHRDATVPIYHVDLYRLEDKRGILGLEYEDFLYENKGVTIVEWPQTAMDLLDEDDILEVLLSEGDSPQSRQFLFRQSGHRYDDVFRALKS